MRYLGSAIACLALCLGAPAVVRAEPMPVPELAIELHGDLPFARAELEDALLPRLRHASIEIRAAALGAAVHVRARQDGVQVQIGPRQRIVPMGERSGAAAARVVALVILDLVPSEGPTLPMPLLPGPAAGPDPSLVTPPSALPDTGPDTSSAGALARPGALPDTGPGISSAGALARPGALPDDRPHTTTAAPPADSARPPPAPRALAYESRPVPPPPPAPPGPPGVAPGPPAPAARLAAAATPRSLTAAPWHVRVSAFGGVVRGPTTDDPGLFSAGADARAGLGAWRAGLGLAWVHLPATDYGQTELGLNALSARAEAGRALGDVELTASAFAMPYRLRATAGGDAHHHGVLLGGGGAARVAAELGRAVRLHATAGVDVFGRRLRVRVPGEVLTSTPAVTLSITVGLSWEVHP